MFITKQFRLEMAHRLCNYHGKCAHLHGHSYLIEVEACATRLTANGMVCDFKDLKHAMEVVLEPYDHALVLFRDDPLVPNVDVLDPPDAAMTQLCSLLRATDGNPPRLHVWDVNPTAEHMAAFFAKRIQNELRHRHAGYAPMDPSRPEHATFISRVTVWETATSCAEWRAPIDVTHAEEFERQNDLVIDAVTTNLRKAT